MLAKTNSWTLREEKSSDGVRERIVEAVKSLTHAELLRLRLFAQYHIRVMGDLAAGREGTDLLHEAIVATLDGRRNWDSDRVPFFHYLFGVMRSVAYAWLQKELTRAHVPSVDEFDADADPDKRAANPFDSIPSGEPSPESQAIAGQLVQVLTDSFHEDEIAQRVLTAMMQGDGKNPEAVGLTPNEYFAAKKRIRRRLQKIIEREEKKTTE